MMEIGAFEAKNKLAELLDRAERGEEIIITRHGRQVARLLPIQKPLDQELARKAVADIRRRRMGLSVDDATIREWISEGRE